MGIQQLVEMCFQSKIMKNAWKNCVFSACGVVSKYGQLGVPNQIDSFDLIQSKWSKYTTLNLPLAQGRNHQKLKEFKNYVDWFLFINWNKLLIIHNT